MGGMLFCVSLPCLQACSHAKDEEGAEMSETAGAVDGVRNAQDAVDDNVKEPVREYEVGGDEVVDLSHGVASARPDDVVVPEQLAKLFSYAVPTLLGMVRRREVLPPLVVIKREADEEHFVEPIEEEMRDVDDLLEYMKRRIANDEADRAARAGQDGCPSAITAYGCAFDQRTEGFQAVAPHDGVLGTEEVDDPAHDTANMALAIVGGCVDSPAGVRVTQRFKPRFLGGAVMLGAPVIEQGPSSLLA